MISDEENLTGVDLGELFSSLDLALKNTGVIWSYNWNNSHLWKSAHKFDKFTHEKLEEYCLTLNAKQSIIAHKSVRDTVVPHIQNKFILKMDARHYYESIHFDSISNHLERAGFTNGFIEHIRKFYFDANGFLRRGLKASPLLSEFIGIKIDNQIARSIHEKKLSGVTYTRFYDDLFTSSDSREDLRIIEKEVGTIFKSISLTINASKSKLMLVENSKILGLRIYKGKIIVAKEFKRILRVREHRLAQLELETNFQDEDSVYELKRYAGHVIGSLWYIVRNSDSDTTDSEQRIEQYKEVLRTCDDALGEIYQENEDDRDVFYH